MNKFTFETYAALKMQVRDIIIGWIYSGKFDNEDFRNENFSNVITILMRMKDEVNNNENLYMNLDYYESMESLLCDHDDYRNIFIIAHVLPLSDFRKRAAIDTVWKNAFLTVFVENYHEFKEIWEERMKSNDDIESR